MSDQPTTPTPPSEALTFVCWRGADGARVMSCPLSRERAEALVRAYAKVFPQETYWTKPVPWLEPVPRPAGPRSVHRA